MSTPKRASRNAFDRTEHPAAGMLADNTPATSATPRTKRASAPVEGGGEEDAPTKAFLAKMTPKMHRDIKIAATLRDTTMQQYVVDAIRVQLDKDNIN